MTDVDLWVRFYSMHEFFKSRVKCLCIWANACI